MPQAVACPKCKTKYSLPDQLLGKPVKCKSCGAMFQVNPPKAPVARQTAPGAQASRKTESVPAVSAAELAKFGLDGPIERQPDLFGEVPHPRSGNPLGNHVVVDPGFANIEFEVPEEENTNDLSAMFHNPALAPAKKKRAPEASKRKKRKRRHPEDDDPFEKAWVIISAIFGIALAAIVIMSSVTDIITTTKVYMYWISPALGLVSFVVSLWWLIRCFETRNSIGEFLLVLIPFYIFVYSLKKEKQPRTRAPLNAWLAMAVIGILMGIAAYFLGITEKMQMLLNA